MKGIIAVVQSGAGVCRRYRMNKSNKVTLWTEALLLCSFLILTACGCAASEAVRENSGGEVPATEEAAAGEAPSLDPDFDSSQAIPQEDSDRPDEVTEAPMEAGVLSVEPLENSLKFSLTTVTEPMDGWVIAFETLNVRKFCYNHGTIIGTFSSGQKITVNGPARYGFYPVTGTDAETGQEITGYCSASYISLVEYTGNAVSLDVVSFTQTDSRWSDLLLGESRFTIGQVGCTTTCFAMSESYLTGTEITPEDMSQILTYTSEANLFWPDEYYQDYTTEYLSEIYMKLHQGIPVLIGSRRKSGGQHWVLVTGYDPGGKTVTRSADLKASDFIINDPSGTRSNLGQFFRDLPYYIKIAYYTG